MTFELEAARPSSPGLGIWRTCLSVPRHKETGASGELEQPHWVAEGLGTGSNMYRSMRLLARNGMDLALFSYAFAPLAPFIYSVSVILLGSGAALKAEWARSC